MHAKHNIYPFTFPLRNCNVVDKLAVVSTEGVERSVVTCPVGVMHVVFIVDTALVVNLNAVVDIIYFVVVWFVVDGMTVVVVVFAAAVVVVVAVFVFCVVVVVVVVGKVVVAVVIVVTEDVVVFVGYDVDIVVDNINDVVGYDVVGNDDVCVVVVISATVV